MFREARQCEGTQGLTAFYRPPATGAYRAGKGVSAPQLVRDVRPQYPPGALYQRIQGTVVLEGIVKTDGSVTAARVIRSLDAKYGLDAAALKAFTNMRFRPGTVSGRPVPILITTEISFSAR